MLPSGTRARQATWRRVVSLHQPQRPTPTASDAGHGNTVRPSRDIASGPDGQPRLRIQLRWIYPAQSKMGGRSGSSNSKYLIFGGGMNRGKYIANFLNGD